MTAMKLAVMGAGPSGFYAVSRILASLPLMSYPDLQVHMYDRVPAPHGLVRYGVAPDHPEVKNCVGKFDHAAQDPRFRFFGNVLVDPTCTSSYQYPKAVPLPLGLMFPYYTHFLFAQGASQPLTLSTLPEATPGLALVHWYTGHPAAPPTPPIPIDAINHLSIIGHGNVSLDIARLLLRDPASLEVFEDLPRHVLQQLEKSTVKHVTIVGRRGPAQVSFTAKELRELMGQPDVSFEHVDRPLLNSARTDNELDRPMKRILDIISKGSKVAWGTSEKSWSLRFLRSPLGCNPSKKELRLGCNTLTPHGQAEASGKEEVVNTDAVVSSVGYRSEVSSGLQPWFDDATGRIRNSNGRVTDSLGHIVRNLYATGWAATGARGVIAAAMQSGYMAADNVLADLQGHVGDSVPSPLPSEPLDGLPVPVDAAEDRITDYNNWRTKIM
ncbi:nucleotide-binding domain-containing protein [Dacryopinax primogenitus]|uniref:Nucleotide-binding domain-containing protein n=1 Tax=Dacryopinax primogenitus (strain DJM 731) TaxID=1858805 RepID=M5FX69_DACPD|nr:nucleotide-binding domain-containing protein [Dacryopinax primogenitus]EJT98071.1 nucleotide-binding domain-containing protein [Dacryopinax primogenitus]